MPLAIFQCNSRITLSLGPFLEGRVHAGYMGCRTIEAD